MESLQLLETRLRKTALFCRLFFVAPFTRIFLLNGSLAQGQAKESSDIDILIITKSGRLYTARFFVLMLGYLSGQKRSKDERKPHGGKFCFNYFLSDDFLKIPMGRGEKMDQYCADNYSASVLIAGDEKSYQNFFKKNQALFSQAKSVPTEHRDLIIKYFPVTEIKFLQMMKGTIEWLLLGKLGGWFESMQKRIQISLIERDERTKQYPDLIVYNDKEARFHPPKISPLSHSESRRRI